MSWAALILVVTIAVCVWTLAEVHARKRQVQQRGFEVITRPEATQKLPEARKD
jgi:hypothetical protein